MADYTRIEDIVAGVDNAAHIRVNSKNDDGTDTVTGVDWFSYGGTVCSSIYANGNGWIGFGSQSEHLKVNRRDQAMTNLWREEGTLSNNSSTYRFLRIRWAGYANYNSAGAPYVLVFNVLMFETGDIMLYMENIPTYYYSGIFSLGDMPYEKPTEDNRYVTFYLQKDGSYVIDYAPIEFAPAYVTKYLIRDGITIYTVTDGALVEVEGDISADLFQTQGTDDIPDGTLLMTLTAPEVLCWTDAEEVPTLTATVQGNPIGAHEIVSDSARIGHSSIYGITSVEATASEGARFLLSFDGGLWMVYDTDSNTFVASDTGMTATELVAIPTEAWTSVVNSAENMRLKAVIEGVENITQVKFNFNNARPI